MKVILIVANGLNCHWLGPYGNEWVSTPAFDLLASESVVFDRHFATDPHSSEILNACLRQFESRSAIFVDDRKSPPGDTLPGVRVVRTNPKTELVSAIQSALKESADLLYIETDRLVPPWDFDFESYQQYAESSGGFVEDRDVEAEEPIDTPIPGPFDAKDHALWHRLHNSFAAAVTSFDAEVQSIVALFRSNGLDRSATWIVTSNHGWPLGEHGVIGQNGSRLHEELVHLPLIIRLPEGREAMRRVSGFTQTSDLGPTIGELLGLNPESPSVLPLIAGPSRTIRESCRIEQSIRTDEWAFLAPADDRPARLYLKPDDIWEANDLAARHPDECDRLAAILQQELRENNAVR